MSAPLATARRFLDAAYSDLEFKYGALLPAEKQPTPGASDWLEKGDWQALAAQVGAEKIFFVGENPVVVFASLENRGEQTLRKLYQRIWCMARPPLLFLARPGELSVYDLAKPPPKSDEKIDDRDRLIKRVTALSEVQAELSAYQRERIETGVVFGDERFGKNLDRADRALIRDLRTVRNELLNVSTQEPESWPEKLSHLHALLARCIFVRYLEDREIIGRDYFEKVADSHKKKQWRKLLDDQVDNVPYDKAMDGILFLRVLRSKEFTYAVFEALADDFNGDSFPIEPTEIKQIHQSHLDLLRGFLCGAPSAQRELFFYAYRFDIIPIELISSIYEEFYNELTGKDRNQGSHYTPSALVEFVLSRTLTAEVLSTQPRVYDPACGSGIFLVESFRRMVRHIWSQRGGKAPSRTELRALLRDQIVGVDLNPEAVRVAAFSLYLAFLHYQHPREINEHRRLPYLKWVSLEERQQRLEERPSAEFFDILLHANAFDVVNGKVDREVAKRFGTGTATVVVGNPPWGYPKKGDKTGSQALVSTLAWCNPKKGRPVGDKELSQAFVHLSLDLLEDGGRAGMLLSSGVLLKDHANSALFRRKWFSNVKLEQVVNFAHVRYVFFAGPHRKAKGVAPFISVVFEKTSPRPGKKHRFPYWSAKRTTMVEGIQSVILNRGDVHYLDQAECLQNEKLWKIYWWGCSRDEALINFIETSPALSSLPKILPTLSIESGRGFEEVAKKGKPSGWLKKYRELPPASLCRYGPQNLGALKKVPEKVYRKGAEEIYKGRRLLVGRGIKDPGIITARFETETYAVRNSVHGVTLKNFEPWQEAVVVGMLWSSLARYYYWLTAGSWGPWHDEIHLDHVKSLPIKLPEQAALKKRILETVSELQTLDLCPEGMELAGFAAQRRLPTLERELDEAIFELYGLDDAERDLVRDMCSLGLDLFYRGQSSKAVDEVTLPAMTSGTLADLADTQDGLTEYLRILLEHWNTELGSEGEFVWRVLTPPSGAPLITVLLETRGLADINKPFDWDDEDEWQLVLSRLDKVAKTNTGSRFVLFDTFFRLVSDHEILIIKRNERRFWTKSAAREDAESTILQSMTLQ